jgi:hypothetical protein
MKWDKRLDEEIRCADKKKEQDKEKKKEQKKKQKLQDYLTSNERGE